MNPLIRLKTTSLLLITLALLCFELSPKVQAVVPPPDGGYPGFNTAEGQNALLHLTTGTANTAVGWFSLESVTTASFNTGVGAGTLVLNSGDQNTATGAAALLLNTTGSSNTANGEVALLSNTTGGHNTATGRQALYSNTAGNNNIALGSDAGFNLTGNFNIDIGNPGVTDESNTIRIGGSFQQATYIAGISGQTAPGGAAVFVASDGKLGTVTSSRRFKKDIADMDAASEALLALRPVTFRYKPELDQAGMPQYGLVAEEVAEVNPNLVVRDEKGEIYTVRYEAVNAMLLNEFLKEHRTVQAQQKEIDALKAELKEQRALIQKVNDKVKLNRSAPKAVVDNR